MTDIFFSYSSTDRERVRLVYEAFLTEGFDVFWDQELPSGIDWDTWIRQHLAKCKCALVFWSTGSIASKNVRHEATVASRQDKLIPVLLEPLTPDQFPMGMYSQQGVNLAGWSGDVDHAEWRKLAQAVEAKLMPAWVQRKIFELDAELTAERARRETAENRVRPLQAQIIKEVTGQDQLKQERDSALDEVEMLKIKVEQLNRSLSDVTKASHDSQSLQMRLEKLVTANAGLKREREDAINEIAMLKTAIDKLNRPPADAPASPQLEAMQVRVAREVQAKELMRRERDTAVAELATLRKRVDPPPDVRSPQRPASTKLQQPTGAVQAIAAAVGWERGQLKFPSGPRQRRVLVGLVISTVVILMLNSAGAPSQAVAAAIGLCLFILAASALVN